MFNRLESKACADLVKSLYGRKVCIRSYRLMDLYIYYSGYSLACQAFVLYFTAELMCYNLIMAAKKASIRNSNRNNGKASKKRPKMFDPQKRRLITI